MINPSNEFLEKLKIEMKQEQEFKSRHNVKKSRKIFLTAASIALIFIGITAYSRISDLQKNDITQKAEISDSSEKNTEQNGIFSNSKWYDSSLSSKEIYDKFISRISSKDDFDKLRVSNTNQFTDDDVMNESEVEELVDLLKDGTLIENGDYSKENPKYYMADFKNGDVIKFTIYNNEYFECNEFEGQFVISNVNR